MKQLWLVAKVLGVYVSIGPLIGLVVFATGVSVLAIVHGPRQAVWLGPFFLLYGIVFAHYVGAIWAVVAGIGALTATRVLGATPSWIGLVGGAISWTVATMAGSAMPPPPPGGSITDDFNALEPAFRSISLLTHLVPSQLCWLIVRHFIPAPTISDTT